MGWLTINYISSHNPIIFLLDTWHENLSIANINLSARSERRLKLMTESGKDEIGKLTNAEIEALKDIDSGKEEMQPFLVTLSNIFSLTLAKISCIV